MTPSDRAHPLDAKQFADEIVEPAIAEFEREPWLRRRAFLACVATFHLTDYITYPARPKEEGLLEDFRRECPAFAAVDRYAKAVDKFRPSPDGITIPVTFADTVLTRNMAGKIASSKYLLTN